MKSIFLSVVSVTLLACAASAQQLPTRTFVPENNLRIPVGSPMARGMQEAQFNTVIDTIERLYKPEIAARGKVLNIKRLWTNETVNASAQQSGNTYILNMYGGLARHETITMDGFALVVCHELGHHMSGAPKVSSWATVEGQSDYYANMKCLKKVFAQPETAAFTRTKEEDDIVAVKSCEQAYSSDEDRAICVRGAMAGKSVAHLFMALRNETVAPRFDTPDTNVVPTMYMKHPGTQCRLDTYLAGSVCTQPHDALHSETDPVKSNCTVSQGFRTGFRPLCWYKPVAAELVAPGANLPGTDLPAYSVLLGNLKGF